MIIKCINSTRYTYLTRNKEYNMLWEDSEMVKIKDDEGKISFYPKKCFEPIYNYEEKNQVNHPTHYNKGIETWDYTDSWDMDFLEGNIIKYVTRYKHKNGVKDLEKAKQYLERLIERENKKND